MSLRKWQTLNIMSPQKKIFLIWILKDFFPNDIIRELVVLWQYYFDKVYYGQHYFECICNQTLQLHNFICQISKTSLFYEKYQMIIDNKCRDKHNICDICESRWVRDCRYLCDSDDNPADILALCPCGNLGSSFPCSDCCNNDWHCSYPECKNIICNETKLCIKHIECHCRKNYIMNFISDPNYYLSYKCSGCQVEMKMKRNDSMRIIEKWNGKFLSAMIKYDRK